MSPINRSELLVQLARCGLTQEQLAQRLHVRPSTFSSWARGVNPAPAGFADRVEDELGLERGSLNNRNAA
jgi:transcriptional regulator with XRE-family HTH domain